MAPMIVDDSSDSGSGEGKKLGITVFSGGMCAGQNTHARPLERVGHDSEFLHAPSIQGTAANSLVDVFNRIAEKGRRQLNYVIPISDNGGSSSELIRFIGGPSKR